MRKIIFIMSLSLISLFGLLLPTRATAAAPTASAASAVASPSASAASAVASSGSASATDGSGAATSASATLSVEIPIRTDAARTVTLDAVSEGEPLPADQVLSLGAGESGTFEIEYDEAGTYDYEIRSDGANAYDLNVYLVNEKAGLSAALIVSRDGKKRDEIYFQDKIMSPAKAPARSVSASDPVETGDEGSWPGHLLRLGLLLFSLFLLLRLWAGIRDLDL